MKTKWYKDPKYWTIGIGAFFILLMVFSTLSMYDPSQNEKVETHGMEFVQAEQGWIAYTDNGYVQLLRDPSTLEDLGDIPLVNFVSVSKIYLTINPLDGNNLNIALQELQRNINYGKLTLACTEDVKGCEDLPLKTCNDASEDTAVIQFENADNSSITFKNNCLLFKGEDYVELIDWFILEQKEE